MSDSDRNDSAARGTIYLRGEPAKKLAQILVRIYAKVDARRAKSESSARCGSEKSESCEISPASHNTKNQT